MKDAGSEKQSSMSSCAAPSAAALAGRVLVRGRHAAPSVSLCPRPFNAILTTTLALIKLISIFSICAVFTQFPCDHDHSTQKTLAVRRSLPDQCRAPITRRHNAQQTFHSPCHERLGRLAALRPVGSPFPRHGRSGSSLRLRFAAIRCGGGFLAQSTLT